ncbi:DUF4244 domain-containing protein [Bifidobacterium sp.]|uniref:DUF4244 domain-containing protein n=1 Tax=Bifidobacterium sp. TaxID=41200 RepID=UPI0025C2DEDF|nr:DUF4244 domain-containing protein [Bifidobacterium sp.]MCI1635019.1 DUF4244 domain-containing protein [Bifidobacterium sp.]
MRQHHLLPPQPAANAPDSEDTTSGRIRSLLNDIVEKISSQCCLLDARMRTAMAEPESGMATAEYAVVLIAATGFAGLLVAILKSGDVRELLMSIVKQALNIG